MKVSHTAGRQGLCACCPAMSAHEYLGSTKSHGQCITDMMLGQPSCRTKHRSTHPSVGIQPTYISEVQCSSACEKEAEMAGHLARVDRLAWQTSINTTWGSGSHCNGQQRIRSWDAGQLLQGRYKDIWYGRQSAKYGQISNWINNMLVKNLPRILSVAAVHSQLFNTAKVILH